MKTTLKLEELAMLLLGIYVFGFLPYAWWWFLLLFLAPDLGMIGYAFGNKAGAFVYNLFHHKGFAIGIYLAGFFFLVPVLQLIGVILFSHAAFDRLLGYGLKYERGFKYTHLGTIGKPEKEETQPS
jgi:MFS family permease